MIRLNEQDVINLKSGANPRIIANFLNGLADSIETINSQLEALGLADTANVGVDTTQTSRLQLIEAFLSQSAVIVIDTANANVTVAEAVAGAVIPIAFSVKVGEDVLVFYDSDGSASVADTIANAGTTPTISDATPAIVNGVGSVSLTLPAEGTYVAGETVTVTITGTMPDGRTITSDDFVVSIVA